MKSITLNQNFSPLPASNTFLTVESILKNNTEMKYFHSLWILSMGCI